MFERLKSAKASLGDKTPSVDMEIVGTDGETTKVVIEDVQPDGESSVIGTIHTSSADGSTYSFVGRLQRGVHEAKNVIIERLEEASNLEADDSNKRRIVAVSALAGIVVVGSLWSWRATHHD